MLVLQTPYDNQLKMMYKNLTNTFKLLIKIYNIYFVSILKYWLLRYKINYIANFQNAVTQKILEMKYLKELFLKKPYPFQNNSKLR